MNVAVVIGQGFDIDRTRNVLAKLREKHPSAVVVMDATRRAETLADAIGLDAVFVPDYLDVADRILVFGPLVSPIVERTHAGTPTVVYTPDGMDVYDEALFVATLISELGAREVHEDDADRRAHTPRAGFDLDTHLRKQRAKDALDKARDEIASAEDPIPANAGTLESAEPPTLFDMPAEKTSGSGAYGATRGEAERDEAMKRIDSNTDDEWKTRADEAILKTGLSLPTFISDDVWRYLDADVHDPRALGPRMTSALEAGLIEKTGAYRKSDRRHASPTTEWRITEHGRRLAA